MSATQDLLDAIRHLHGEAVFEFDPTRMKMIVCPTQEIADRVSERVTEFDLTEHFRVVTNEYMPKGKIFIITSPPDFLGEDPREEGDPDMGIVKHGEGEVLPENEQQKTAQQQGGGMSAEAREALDRENEEADGGSAEPTAD